MALKEVKDLDKFEMTDVLDAGSEGKLVELLVDTEKGKVFHVHPPKGHLEAAAEYLDIPWQEVNRYNSGHLVSAIVQVKGKFLIHLSYGGGTSLELTTRIEHTEDQMGRAKEVLEELIKRSQKKGEIIVIGNLKDKERPLGVR